MGPRRKAIRRLAKTPKFGNETSLAEIIALASSSLVARSEDAQKYLVSLAKDGILEQHQTKGSITKLADELVKKMRG